MNESLNLTVAQKQQTTLAPMQLQFVRMLEMNEAEAVKLAQRLVGEKAAE